MAVEIERKFLVAGAGWRPHVARSTRMVQGYLGGERASVRVRIEGGAAKLNVKSKTAGMRRDEFEFDIPRADADAMLASLCVGTLAKVRHEVPNGPYTFEIDEFEGANRGLVVAEIELPSEQAAFGRPAWLGPEVTDEPRYYNASLVHAPFELWPDRAGLVRIIEGA